MPIDVNTIKERLREGGGGVSLDEIKSRVRSGPSRARVTPSTVARRAHIPEDTGGGEALAALGRKFIEDVGPGVERMVKGSRGIVESASNINFLEDFVGASEMGQGLVDIPMGALESLGGLSEFFFTDPLTSAGEAAGLDPETAQTASEFGASPLLQALMGAGAAKIPGAAAGAFSEMFGMGRPAPIRDVGPTELRRLRRFPTQPKGAPLPGLEAVERGGLVITDPELLAARDEYITSHKAPAIGGERGEQIEGVPPLPMFEEVTGDEVLRLVTEPDMVKKLDQNPAAVVTLTDHLFRQTTNVVKRFGEPGEELAQRLMLARDNAEQLAGGYISPMLKDVKPLNPAQQDNLVAALRGEGIPNPEVTPAYARIRSQLELLSNRANAPSIQAKVLDPVTGKEVPLVPKDAKNFYPTYVNINEILRNSHLKEEAVKFFKRKNPALNDDQAITILQDLGARQNTFGGLLQIPKAFDGFQFASRNPQADLSRFYETAWSRIEERNQLSRRYTEGILKRIKETSGNAAENFSRKVIDRALRRGNTEDIWHMASIAEGLRGFMVATKLGQAVFLNATQPTLLAVRAGFLPTFKAFKRLKFSGTKDEARDLALRSGSALDLTVRQMFEELGSIPVSGGGSGARKFARLGSQSADFVLRNSGFNAIERFNRRLAANTGREYALHIFDRLKKPGGIKNNLLRREIEKLGLGNPEMVVKQEALTDQQILKAAQAMTNVTQFKVDARELPLFWSSPLGRFMTQFKSFAFKAGQFIGREILQEAAKGNIKPLARAAVAMPIAGEAANNLADFLRGRDPLERGVGLRSIDEKLEPGSPGWLLARYIGDVAAVGAAGIFFDLWRSAVFGELGLWQFAGGPSIATMIEASQITRHPSRLPEFVGGNLPLPFIPQSLEPFLREARKQAE